MHKNAKKRGSDQEQIFAPEIHELLGVEARGDLHDWVVAVGLRALQALLEQERDLLCGPRYRHSAQRLASRGGHVPSSLPLGGQRVAVKRPRVVGADGREIPLESWRELSSSDPLMERAYEQMVLGVATRRYHRSLERLPDGVAAGGTSRSSVSRRFAQATAARLDQLLRRDLSPWDIVGVYIDGLHFRGHVVLVALGVDVEGYKHILGLWDGATENEVACDGLLSDLVVRGLKPRRMRLFVIDGAKGLRRSISNVFGAYALVQRCQFHKVRNVINHLPKAMHPSVRKALHQAYKSPDLETAKRLLHNLARRLQEERPSAAASVREGLEETLTTRSLGLPRRLERSFSTTNPLESVNDQLRFISRRVKKWRGGTMILRWVAAGALEAECSFRRVHGALNMPKLVQALRQRESRLLVQQRAA